MKELAGSFFNRHGITHASLEKIQTYYHVILNHGIVAMTCLIQDLMGIPDLVRNDNASNFLVRSTSSTCLLAHGFRFYFMGSSTLLFTFPSRYSFTIGLAWYLALERGRPRFRREFAVSQPTQESFMLHNFFQIRDFHSLWSPIPQCSSKNYECNIKVLQPLSLFIFDNHSFFQFFPRFCTLLQRLLSAKRQFSVQKGFIINYCPIICLTSPLGQT